MTENQRLKFLLPELGFTSQLGFAKALNITAGGLSDVLRSKGGIGVSDKIKRILEHSYNINIKWLESGEGEIYSVAPKEPINISESDITTLKRNVRKQKALIPYYNADFMAGNSDVFYEDGTIYPEYYMDVPEFYGCTAFRAYSDSMEPKIRSGAILFGVKVEDWQSSLEYGQIYGITLNDGRRFLKYIRRSQDYKTEFILKSENPLYDDFEIQKTKIKNIWLIEGWLDKRT
ncbi:S24 family peptidase [Pedobacter lusitanus]|uniref:S24 family peptidase n=1 Tax=Pedobacter lusitanus TaxID=1503925 RepID=UPI0006978A43|nr:S24 family peptidase [Pedobacter lusitanus]